MKNTFLLRAVSLFFVLSTVGFAQLANHVVIAEVFGGGGNTGPSAPYLNDYIVLYNPTGSAVNVSGWSIQYAAATGTTWVKTNLVGSIPPQSYYLIQQDAGSGGQGINLPYYPNISGSILINPSSGKIALVNNQLMLAGNPTLPDANIIDFVGFGSADLSETGTAATGSNILSIRRKDNNGIANAYNYGLNGSGWDSDDNSADFYQQANLLYIPNYPLSSTYLANHIVIAEVYGGGGLSGASYTNDYVVLYNSTSSTVDLSTHSLQYTSDNGTIWSTINLSGTIAANRYYLIQLGSGGANGGPLPETPVLTDATDIDISNGKLALVRNQTALSGSNPVTSDEDIVDMVGYGPSADGYEGTIGPSSSPSNTSSIRRKDKNGNNTYGLSNGSGWDANNNSGDFYIEADIINNPPAPSSAKADHVVIAEIYGGGGNSGSYYANDYVVLYNPTASTVDVSTWSLQYIAGATTTGSWSSLNLTGSIASLSYYMIQLGSSGSGASLPVTPNVTGSYTISATLGKVALVKNTIVISGDPTLPDANIEDFVGYGSSATVFEGSGRAPAPSNASSIRRIDNIGNNTYGLTDGSGWDTDNNNADFYVEYDLITNTPLPVELSSFTASNIGSNVKLNWRTESEVNNYGFEVERMSNVKRQSSNSWETIGFVNGNGNSNSPKDYSFVDENLPAGKYSYRLKQIDNDGQFEYSQAVEVSFMKPNAFSLEQNFPNPFNPNTTIKFALPEAGNVKLTLYNILGQEIKILVNGFTESGVHSIDLNASNLNSGIYIYKIETGSFVQTRKMTLLK